MTVSAMTKKKSDRVVVHFLDGSLLKGRTKDFGVTSDTFHLTDAGMQEHAVTVGELKAVFFVKTLEGDRCYKEKKGFHDKRRKGKKVMVEFFDGELLFGLTHVSYADDDPGFFMFPGDPNSNNIKVFIVRSATKRIKVRDTETQKEEVFS